MAVLTSDLGNFVVRANTLLGEIDSENNKPVDEVLR